MANDNFLYILLADDDADDRMIFGEALEEIGLDVICNYVEDGVQLMDYLLGSGIILPQIIFLDLNMPIKNGFQCLNEIRSIKAFRDMFIVMYSTTARPIDINNAYEKGASMFIHKPSSFTELKEIMRRLFTTTILKLRPSKEEFIFRLEA